MSEDVLGIQKGSAFVMIILLHLGQRGFFLPLLVYHHNFLSYH